MLTYFQLWVYEKILIYWPKTLGCWDCLVQQLSCLGEYILHSSIQVIDIYWEPAAAAAKLLQSCPTLCNPIDGSPPGSPVPGILQARTLEWVAISFSSAWKWKVKVKSLSRVWLLPTPWTTAYQAPPSMGFSRQEYWSGVPLPSPTENLQVINSVLATGVKWWRKYISGFTDLIIHQWLMAVGIESWWNPTFHLLVWSTKKHDWYF